LPILPQILGKNCIGYSDSADGDHIFYAVDPVTNNQLPLPFHQATLNEVEQTVTLAHQGFLAYSRLQIVKRIEFLNAIPTAIRAHSSELIHWFCLESGLSEARGKKELERACFQFEAYAKALEMGYPFEAKIDPPTDSKVDLRKLNIPLGPVVVFGASNFPFAYSTIGGDVASALTAGCSVIVKAHPMHPHTSELAARIILEVAQSLEMPDGVFSHLLAADHSVGKALTLHSGIKAIGFTGSIQGGMALHQLAQTRTEPIPVFAEMGSSNPIVITEDAVNARGANIAQEIAQSVSLDAGQFCTSPGIVFLIQRKKTPDFIEQLKGEFLTKESQVMLHQQIFDRYQERSIEQSQGAEIIVEGKRSVNWIQPTLIQISARKFITEPKLQEEVFGSFLTLVVCQDEQELIESLKTLKGQLTASLYCESKENVADLLHEFQRFAGRIILNGVPTGVAVSVAMQHGGPFPSSNNPSASAIGADAIKRFMRPVTFQNCQDELLPEALKRANPLKILRFVNDKWTNSAC